MKVEIKAKFQIVTPEEGFVLTNYKEGDDILTYSSFKSCYCPLDCDLKHISEISIEEDAILMEKLEELLKLEEEKYKL
jgi:hypothetical protein